MPQIGTVQAMAGNDDQEGLRLGPRGFETVGGRRVISMPGFAGRGGTATTQYPWGDDVFLQGGNDGVVWTPHGTYRTTFVEVLSPTLGFVRGEGADIAEAEDACWAKCQAILSCEGHHYEPGPYRNGGGLCARCGRFEAKAFLTP